MSAAPGQNIYFVSLGCPKNQVDTEVMLGQVQAAGHALCDVPEDAVALRKRHGAAVFAVGLACSVIPFFAPLVGASAMTRLVHSLSK